MKLFTVIILTTICIVPSWAGEKDKKKVERVMYYNKTFGHIHKSPSRYSHSLSTLACAHPVKVLSINGQDLWADQFHYVVVGPYEGYIHRDYLDAKKTKCVQDKYPRFFNKLDLSISDMYYWGKLYDQYVRGSSKAR